MHTHNFLHGRTTVGERGQIVIPQSIRTALKLKHGDELVVMCRGEKIIIVPSDKLASFFETIFSHADVLRTSLQKTKPRRKK